MPNCPRCGAILSRDSIRCPSCAPVSLAGVGGAPDSRPTAAPTTPTLSTFTPSEDALALLAAQAEQDRRDRKAATAAGTVLGIAALLAVIGLSLFIYGRVSASRAFNAELKARHDVVVQQQKQLEAQQEEADKERAAMLTHH